MLKSMTAFGRAIVNPPLGRFSCEIQSLNRKYLEVQILLPQELASFEAEVRKWISMRIGRGKVSLKIFARFDVSSPLAVQPNLPLAKQIQSACEEIAKVLELEDASAFVQRMLGHEPGLLSHLEDFEDVEAYREPLREVIEQALDALVEMKQAEGVTIQNDFLARCNTLEGWISQIEANTDGAVDHFREKIRSRIEEVLPGVVEQEERLLREVCLYAEKVDISEEILRFRSHLKQFVNLLQAEKEGVGKTLEFLLQELHRETNTIGSKCADIDTSRLVVDIKSELEKIREQVQNVE